MIEEFKEWLEGKFENRKQALSNPSRYAYIRVTHINIGDGLFYGEQAYNYKLTEPYRQFVLEPVLEGDSIRILNYEIENKKDYLQFNNLEKLNKSKLILRPGCDVVVTKKNDLYVGGITGCECMVDWQGRSTYLQNEITLAKDYYCVIDRGYCAQHGHQLWGSKYGRFEFMRI